VNPMRRWWRAWRQGGVDHRRQPQVIIQQEVVDSTDRALQRHRNSEALVYWAGRSSPQLWAITTGIEPETALTEGSFRTSAAANAKVIGFLAARSLELLAQVHSHPGPLVDHSLGDERGALMPYESFLSIVVPNYGRRGLDLAACGVHRFEGGRFRRLSATEVNAIFTVAPTFQAVP
jgi:hypothetical protein